MLDPEIARILDESQAKMRAQGAVDFCDSKPGDMLLDGRIVVRRHIRTKAAAQALAASIPRGRWLIDGARTWCVTKPREDHDGVVPA